MSRHRYARLSTAWTQTKCHNIPQEALVRNRYMEKTTIVCYIRLPLLVDKAKQHKMNNAHQSMWKFDKRHAYSCYNRNAAARVPTASATVDARVTETLSSPFLSFLSELPLSLPLLSLLFSFLLPRLSLLELLESPSFATAAVACDTELSALLESEAILFAGDGTGLQLDDLGIDWATLGVD